MGHVGHAVIVMSHVVSQAKAALDYVARLVF